MLDIGHFQKLLDRTEGDALDWKRDFPPGLLTGKSSPRWEKDRGKLLKSLVALANGEGDPKAFLIYGVDDGVWFPQGSRNSVAQLADLRRMVLGHEPWVVPSTTHEGYRTVEIHYARQGRGIRCVLMNLRDGLLGQGYEPAYYPGTRRELRVVFLAGQIREEHSVLVAPCEESETA